MSDSSDFMNGGKSLSLSRRGLQKIPEEVLKYPNPENVITIFISMNKFVTLKGLNIFTNVQNLHMDYSLDATNFKNEPEEKVGQKILIKKESSGTVTRTRTMVRSNSKVVDETKKSSEESNKILAKVTDTKKNPLIVLPPSEFSQFKDLKELHLCGCFLSPVSCNQVISSFPLTKLFLNDNPSLGAFLTSTLPLNVETDISTFSVDTLLSSFGTYSSSTTTSSSSPSEIQPIENKEEKPRKESIDVVPDSSWSFFKSLSGTLQKLSIQQCDMHSFPLSICQLTNLVELNISVNSLKRIPPQIVKLTNLEFLDLDQTKLTEFPIQVIELKKLSVLLLSRNNITALPNELSSLKYLKKFDISYNDIETFQEVFNSFDETFLTVCGNPFCISYTDSRFKHESLRSIKYVHYQTSIPDEIIPNLYLGDIECSYNKHCLHHLNITHVLSVLPRFPPPYPHKYKYLVVNLEDSESSDLKSYFPQTTQFIKEAIASNGSILIHCAAGVSRSASVVIAYLIAEQRMTVRNALEFVRKKREIICPNSGFLRQLEEWEAKEMPLYHWANKLSNALF